MIRRITVGVNCAKCGQQYGQDISVETYLGVFEQAQLRIPCCGACGDEDITLAIRVKDVKEEANA